MAKRKIKPFGRDDIYLDEGHRERFLELLNSKSTGSLMRVSENYLAALFLLTVDERLWELSKDHVNGFGINFKDIRISEMNFTRYMMLVKRNNKEQIATKVLTPALRGAILYSTEQIAYKVQERRKENYYVFEN